MNFTHPLVKNIEKTYTYSYAKNTGKYDGTPEKYDVLDFFEHLLRRENPFKVFMELERYAFANAKRALIKYDIPYTEKQERAAKVFSEVTTQMEKERSDYVSLYVEDLTNTGIVKYSEPFVLTTKDTLYVADEIRKLPRQKTIFNVLHGNDIPDSLKASREQYNALKTCLTNQISCLIGGAGTGKSFVTASIIKQLQKNGKDVAVLAPTHKAREALQSKLMDDDTQVRTIHSFVHNPFNCDVIVIDESGMLSTTLVAKLMRIYKKQQLVFIGDKNQLEPVGYGGHSN